MPSNVSGIILAGGKSRRMGCNKAFLDLAGSPLIARVADRLRQVADEIIIVAGTTELYAGFGDHCIADEFPGMGPLGGIHAGLRAAGHDRALAVGCDMPFLNPALLEWFAQAVDGFDLAVLQQGEWLEPLHAAYRKSCLPVIEAALRAGERIAFSFYDRVRARRVAPAQIAHLDPILQSFRNVNTPKEWQAALMEWPQSVRRN